CRYSHTVVRAETTRIIQCTPDQFLELVMDIEAYAEVDEKIRPIYWSRRTGNVLEFQFRPKLPGTPIPAPKLVQRVELTPGRRVDVTNAPWPHNKVGNRMSSFAASFVCEPIDGATVVTRTIELNFPAPMRWLMEPILKRRLQTAVEDEIDRAKQRLESASAS
ncbi:MAG: SRPBCC family protein, partial [Mycobacterium sp.]